MSSPSGTSELTANQKTVVAARSVLPSLRMTMVTDAVRSAAASATEAPSNGTSPLPGCTIRSTPANPAATAPQRHLPVGSPSMIAARTTEKIGTENPIVVASASGSRMKARKLSAIAVTPSAIRPTCAHTRLVRRLSNPGPSPTKAVAQSVDPHWR